MEIYIPTAAPVACSIIVSVSNVAEADFISDDLPLAVVIPAHTLVFCKCNSFTMCTK